MLHSEPHALEDASAIPTKPEPRARGEVTREPLGGLWGWARWAGGPGLGGALALPAGPARGSRCASWVWTKDVVQGGAEANQENGVKDPEGKTGGIGALH